MNLRNKKGFLYLFLLILVSSFSYAQSFDVISNNDEWFVCDATSSQPDVGPGFDNYVDEYGTVESPSDSNPTCADFLTTKLTNYDFVQCDGTSKNDCPSGTVNGCTLDTNTGQIPLVTPEDGLSQCELGCFYNGGNPLSGLLVDPTIIAQIYDGGLNPDGNVAEGQIPKVNCENPENCLDSLSSCTDLGGEVCSESQVCVNGYYSYASDGGDILYLNQPGNKCCVGELAECKDKDEVACSDLGGVEKPVDGYLNCIGTLATDACCIGEWHKPSILVFSNDISKSFICLKQNNNNLFMECCDKTDKSSCKNAFNPNSKGDDYLRTLIVGDSYNKIDDFDAYPQGQDFIVDNVWKSTLEQVRLTGEYYSWEGFEFIEFDFALNTEIIDSDYVYIGVRDDAHKHRLLDYINNGVGALRWHHAKIPTNGFVESDRNRGGLWFETGATQILIDNIRLIDEDGSDSSKKEERYCGYSNWIQDLDNIAGGEESEYRAACNAQLSYRWTGSMCCGDDTTHENYGEYYADDVSGCFKGQVVKHDETLTRAQNIDSEWGNHLLFNRGQFHVCGKDPDPTSDPAEPDIAEDYFERVFESTTGVESTTILPFIAYTGFEVVDNKWFCDETEGWRTTADSELGMAILAATFRQMGEDSQNSYTVHCGDQSIFNDPIESTTPIEENFCVLNIYDDDDEVIIGYVTDNAISLTKSIFSSYWNFNTLGDNAELDCSSWSADGSNNFQECTLTYADGSEVPYAKVYSFKPFATYYIEVETPSAFNFVRDVFDRLVDFFRNLFGTTDGVGISVNVEDSGFDDLYIAKFEDGQYIKGIREGDSLSVEIQSGSDSIGDYEDLLIDTFDLASVSYEDNQINGFQAYNHKFKLTHSKVPDFEMKYLTSNLRFK